jgi:2-polyprenyl-6-methoxyphenol hydroxylase-like FAD-dependent oxidoreductase
MTRRVDVIGGGPGGLYVARLLKLNDPGLEVTVHERMDGAQETFGFGVGLTEATMRNLRQADPETAERVRGVSYAGPWAGPSCWTCWPRRRSRPGWTTGPAPGPTWPRCPGTW